MNVLKSHHPLLSNLLVEQSCFPVFVCNLSKPPCCFGEGKCNTDQDFVILRRCSTSGSRIVTLEKAPRSKLHPTKQSPASTRLLQLLRGRLDTMTVAACLANATFLAHFLMSKTDLLWLDSHFPLALEILAPCPTIVIRPTLSVFFFTSTKLWFFCHPRVPCFFCTKFILTAAVVNWTCSDAAVANWTVPNKKRAGGGTARQNDGDVPHHHSFFLSHLPCHKVLRY